MRRTRFSFAIVASLVVLGTGCGKQPENPAPTLAPTPAQVPAQTPIATPVTKADSGPREESLTNDEKIQLRRVAKRNSVLVTNVKAKGSGLVIKRFGEKAIVLTNAHVVLTADGFIAKGTCVRGPESKASLPAMVLSHGKNDRASLDFAYLVVHDPDHTLGQEVVFAAPPLIGDYVVAVGNPREEEFLVDDGFVRKINEASGIRVIEHDALVEHGSSGGGLFNSKGQLVGINTYLAGDKRTGIAVFPSQVLDKMKVYSTVANATSDWEDTGIRVPKNALEVWVLADGKWKVSAWLDAVTGDGIKDYEKHSYNREHLHGALLVQIGTEGPMLSVNKVWKGPDPGNSVFLQWKDPGTTGGLRFRINDTDLKNNSGKLNITVMILER